MWCVECREYVAAVSPRGTRVGEREVVRHLSISISIYRSIDCSIYLSSLYIYLYLSVHLFYIYLSISIYLSIYLAIFVRCGEYVAAVSPRGTRVGEREAFGERDAIGEREDILPLALRERGGRGVTLKGGSVGCGVQDVECGVKCAGCRV